MPIIPVALAGKTVKCFWMTGRQSPQIGPPYLPYLSSDGSKPGTEALQPQYLLAGCPRPALAPIPTALPPLTLSRSSVMSVDLARCFPPPRRSHPHRPPWLDIPNPRQMPAHDPENYRSCWPDTNHIDKLLGCPIHTTMTSSHTRKRT